LKNGHYLFTYLVPEEPNNVVMEKDLLGRIYTIYNIQNGAHHDFAELPDGNILVTTQESNSYTIADSIIEIDRNNGQIIQNFDLKNYLDNSRKGEIEVSSQDWLHMDSIVFDPYDQSIIFSSRTQSAVIKMSYPDMEIQWILGPHDNWATKYQPFLLTPMGDNFEWQWSQHDATIISESNINGNKIIDLLLFDNGLYRSFDLNTALSPANSYSRIVLYRIDETNRTVEQLWEYGKERGSELFSDACGSAYLLGNGDYFGDWAEVVNIVNGLAEGVTGTSEVIEVNPTNNEVVFEARVINYAGNCRTFRGNLYDGYSAENFGLSVKIDDTTSLIPGS